MRVAVLGAGAWGTSLAITLADAGHDVALWGRDRAAIEGLRTGRENRRYLPGRRLPAGVEPTSDLAAAVARSQTAVLALPAACVREVVRRMRPDLVAGTIVACASKGLEPETRQTLDRVLAADLPGAAAVMLSGPTFAAEIAAGLPAAAVAASGDAAAARAIQELFPGDRLRIYTSDDVVGVAIGGALKNVIAIAVGCVDGLGFGHNARAALITRGLNEVGRLAARLGGNPLTLAGLAGLGDLVLTCTGELSRNRQVGLGLAAGESLARIHVRLGHVAEGVTTAGVADELARSLGVDMPITAQVAAVVAGSRSPRQAAADLLSRGQGPERG